LKNNSHSYDDRAKHNPGESGESTDELIVPISPLVSVVIPTCNRSALLTGAIQSVRLQTYRNLEIIVIDDASTDDTQEIVEGFADPRIRYLRHDINRGGAAARNTGIRAAAGEYIAFLDDDDEWAPAKTDEQLEVLEDDGCDVVMCTWDQHGEQILKFGGKKIVELEDLRQGRFTAGGTGVLMARAAVVKKTMFDESLPRYQDWDLFIRIANKHKICYLNRPLVRYNKGAHLRITNSILNVPVMEVEQQYRMIQKHREFFGTRWFRSHMSRALLYGIRHRQNKIAHLAYTARKYGVINVVRFLGMRMRTIVSKRLNLAARHTQL